MSSPSEPEVAIIGAGPYGLSLAAHLTSRNVEHRIFGSPMLPWSRMHRGMGLKSPDFGTNIYAPVRGSRFVEWCRERGISTTEPIAIELFTEYGRWAQHALVPELEQVDVTSLRQGSKGFTLQLSDGTGLSARRVVVATGLSHFARMPLEFEGLPADLASHTTAHREYTEFARQTVVVVGGGASALEAGVMLQEAGADVQVIMRRSSVYLGGPRSERRSLRQRLLHPNSVLGPGRKSFLLQRVPMATHYMPVERRVRFVKTYLGPAAGWWLGERAKNLPLQKNARVIAASPTAAGLRLKLRVGNEEQVRDVQHAVCGTGFEVDVDRLPFLESTLAATIRRIERAPALSRHFESSVPGLYFIGPSAAFSFGPLLRFVAGAEYAVPVVAGRLAERRRQTQSQLARDAVSEPA
jgi:cation diffusion facilitator CzcD-associated flavoprotein CzcO